MWHTTQYARVLVLVERERISDHSTGGTLVATCFSRLRCVATPRAFHRRSRDAHAVLMLQGGRDAHAVLMLQGGRRRLCHAHLPAQWQCPLAHGGSQWTWPHRRPLLEPTPAHTALPPASAAESAHDPLACMQEVGKPWVWRWWSWVGGRSSPSFTHSGWHRGGSLVVLSDVPRAGQYSRCWTRREH